MKKVVRRSARKVETAGELLDAYENEPPPKINILMLERLLNERSQRSGERKSK